MQDSSICPLEVATRIEVATRMRHSTYGVAPISRLLKITGRFCKRALLKRLYSAKETYDFKERTNRSHLGVYLIDTVLYP